MRTGHFAVLTAVACGTAPVEPRAWVSASAWDRVPAAADPWLTDVPADDPCDPLGWGSSTELGDPTFDVQTGQCDPLTAWAPTETAMGEDETLEIRIWHYALLSPGREPAIGRVEMRVGADAWSVEVPIPSEAGMIHEFWTPRLRYPPGTPVLFHLSNHGANSWHLFDVNVVSAVTVADRSLLK